MLSGNSARKVPCGHQVTSSKRLKCFVNESRHLKPLLGRATVPTSSPLTTWKQLPVQHCGDQPTLCGVRENNKVDVLHGALVGSVLERLRFNRTRAAFRAALLHQCVGVAHYRPHSAESTHLIGPEVAADRTASRTANAQRPGCPSRRRNGACAALSASFTRCLMICHLVIAIAETRRSRNGGSITIFSGCMEKHR